jgi:hypothetical protein
MLFKDFIYTPNPALQNVRLTCVIHPQEQTPQIEEYQINPQHRNGNPNKSQWSIICEEEIAVFAQSCNDGMVEDDHYMWGLYMPGDKPAILGSTKNSDDSKIAIFDNGKQNGFWHGYPADYIRNNEVPPSEILAYWKTKEYINKSDINKIIKGLW